MKGIFGQTQEEVLIADKTMRTETWWIQKTDQYSYRPLAQDGAKALQIKMSPQSLITRPFPSLFSPSCAYYCPKHSPTKRKQTGQAVPEMASPYLEGYFFKRDNESEINGRNEKREGGKHTRTKQKRYPQGAWCYHSNRVVKEAGTS